MYKLYHRGQRSEVRVWATNSRRSLTTLQSLQIPHFKLPLPPLQPSVHKISYGWPRSYMMLAKSMWFSRTIWKKIWWWKHGRRKPTKMYRKHQECQHVTFPEHIPGVKHCCWCFMGINSFILTLIFKVSTGTRLFTSAHFSSLDDRGTEMWTDFITQFVSSWMCTQWTSDSPLTTTLLSWPLSMGTTHLSKRKTISSFNTSSHSSSKKGEDVRCKFIFSSQKWIARFYIIAEFQIFLLPFVRGQLKNQELT